ncbi:MAG: type II toxin-antitoxin system HicB family antitoxin [Synergistaceae bacterium]|jgi:predicted RNase H-like HicB family nuclease|nr:type II toxin-antitoxin system HicB family antitoxin [Synergistaceae bacterium]
MSKYNVTAVVYPQSEGGYSVVCPDISGCATQGNTLDEALKNIKEAVELRLEGDSDALEELKASSMPGRIVAEVEIDA